MSFLVKDKPFYRAFTAMTVPLSLMFLLQISVNTLNSVMLGSFSEVQMAAMSLAAQVFFIFSVLTYGFSASASVLISQYWGKNDMDSIRTVFSLGLRCNLILGVVVTTVVLCFPGAIMRVYSSDPEVISLGISYMRIAAFTCVPIGACNTMYQCYKGVEKARIVAISSVITHTLNIAFSYILIFGKLGLPAMEVRGAALGAVLARIVEIGIMLGFMYLGDNRIRFKIKYLLTKNLAVGIPLLRGDFFKLLRPLMGHEIIWSFGMTATQAIMGQISTSAIAAFNVCYVLYEIAIAPLNGMSGAATTLIGKAVGKGQKPEVKQQAYTLMLICTVYGVAGALLLLFGGGAFSSLYALSPQSLGYVRSIMPIMAGVVFFSAWEVVGLVGVLRGGGDAKTGFYTDCVVMWCIAIPLGLIASLVFDLHPVFVILILKMDMPLKGAVGLIRVLRMRWVTDMTRDHTAKPVET